MNHERPVGTTHAILRRWSWLLLLSALVLPQASLAQEPPNTNYDESKVPTYELPDPLVSFDGRQVSDAATWRETRRPEILRAFAQHVYGRTPEIATRLRFETLGADATVFEGLATRKQIRIRLLESDAAPWIDLLLYVPSAEQDRWADPRGEFLAARHAEPVYELLGRPGLGLVDMPGVDQPVGRSIGYHMRTGDHEITPYDWGRYLDFADRHLRKRRVLYNFDGDSCLSTKAGGKGPVAVDVDDVKRLIAEVAYDGSRVDTVLVCVNAQVMYYPTKVGTMRGTLSSPAERAQWPASEKQRFENLKAFFDNGVDPYAIMLADAKRRGREALLTFRMNDDHGNDFLRTQFLVDHPDWRLGNEQYRGLGAMDFGRDEVRDHMFRLIEEATKRYDCDGIELDFNRFPTFFKDGSTDEWVAKMNSLVERVRKMLDDVGGERGRRLVLAVRVPSNYGQTPPTPETARQLGCDVPTWAKQGWIDFVTVSEFLFERGDLPIDKWKQAIPTVPVSGGIECTRGGGQKNLSADEYRHAATELIQAGSAGVYLFNFFTSREEGENAYEPPFEVLRELGTPIVVPKPDPAHKYPTP